MPPQQCPECARFLSGAFVAGLDAAPAPCPKCGTLLTAEMYGGSVRPPDEPAVRPPDLPPAEVREPEPDGGRDVLAGWDETPAPSAGRRSGDAEVVDLARWRGENQGLEPETVALLVAGAGALGVAVGAALSPESRTKGAFVGAMLAAIAGVVATSWSRR